MYTNTRELMVTITHADLTKNTAVILSSLSDATQASVNYHQAYQLKKVGQ